MSAARPNVRLAAAEDAAPVYSLDLYRMQERLRGDVIGVEPDQIDRRAVRRAVCAVLGVVLLVGLLLLRLV